MLVAGTKSRRGGKDGLIRIYMVDASSIPLLAKLRPNHFFIVVAWL